MRTIDHFGGVMQKFLCLIALGLLCSCGEARSSNPFDPGPLTEADDPFDPGPLERSEADQINTPKAL